MKTHQNINIILKMTTDDLVVKDLVNSFDDLEASLYRIDRELIEEVSHKLELDKLLVDAALERVRKYRGQRLRIKHVKEGSFIFELVLAGVGIWVLKQTVGESVKKGWSDSDSHIKLSKAIGESVDNLAYRVVTMLHKSGRSISKSKIELLHEKESKEPTIYITQKRSSTKREEDVPPLSEVIKLISDTADLENRKGNK